MYIGIDEPEHILNDSETSITPAIPLLIGQETHLKVLYYRTEKMQEFIKNDRTSEIQKEYY